MNELRKDLPELPGRISKLPVDARGYPVPWFVAWIDGKPDFRIIASGKIVTAVRDKLCWTCGERLGQFLAYVIGPMCAMNRVSSEPPSHRECAEFAARACPFLSRPHMRRRDGGLEEMGTSFTAGIPLDRNPGVALVWVSKTLRPVRVENGILFDVGDPVEVLWFCEGRPATREEVRHSIDTGFPILAEMAEKDGGSAPAELASCYLAALDLLPAEEGG